MSPSPLAARPIARSISRLRVPLGDRLALVGLAPSSPERQLDLGPALAEVQAQRHERQALLGDAGLQAVDLVAVEEQLAPPVGIVGTDVGGELVRRDVHPLEPQLAGIAAGEAVGELDVAEAQALDLAPGEHDAGLDDVEHLVVVPGAAIAGDQLGAALVSPRAACEPFSWRP